MRGILCGILILCGVSVCDARPPAPRRVTVISGFNGRSTYNGWIDRDGSGTIYDNHGRFTYFYSSPGSLTTFDNRGRSAMWFVDTPRSVPVYDDIPFGRYGGGYMERAMRD